MPVMRFGRARSWVASLVAVVLWTAVPAAGQTTGQIVGSVADASHMPLGGVAITLQGAIQAVSHTGVDGQFVVRNLPPGEYDLTASLTGFRSARRTVEVPDTQASISVSLVLEVAILERTIVTAAKLGETDVQAIPMAVSVLTGTELARMERHNVAHIAGLAPSVTLSQNTGFAQLTIRGIGTNAVFSGSDPSSAVYVDGVYLARPAMVLADFLDLERIEVLRGPQGTLYGRNVVGGALNLTTRMPTEDVEAAARVTMGTYGMLRPEVRVSGPILSGRLMGSAAVMRGVRQGFVRDLEHPDETLGGEDVTAARGSLRLVFDRRSQLIMSTDVTHDDARPLTYAKVLVEKPGYDVNNPADFYAVRASTLARGHNMQYGASARLRIDLTPTTRLTSVSAYRALDYQRLVDTDITELDLNATDIHEIQHQLSEEVTISHSRPGMTAIGGLFLFGESDLQPTMIRMAAAERNNLLNPRVEAQSRAAFAETTVATSARGGVTFGLRYTKERKQIDNSGALVTLGEPAAVLMGSAYAYADTLAHDAWTPKIGYQWRPGGHVLAYVSATRGFKSGGFNLTSMEVGRGYAPEWAWSYEGGLKTDIAGGRARVNLSVFHTDYTNLQVQTGIRPGVIDISNAAAATIRGVEVEGATAAVAGGVRVGGHLAWLSATYDEYTATAGGITADVAGHWLNNAPEWSGRAWLEWSLSTFHATSVSLRADSTWRSSAFFSPFNDPIQGQGPYGLVTISAELRPQGQRWSVGAFARNVTNQEYITGTFSTAAPAFGGRPGDPRQIGIQLAVQR